MPRMSGAITVAVKAIENRGDFGRLRVHSAHPSVAGIPGCRDNRPAGEFRPGVRVVTSLSRTEAQPNPPQKEGEEPHDHPWSRRPDSGRLPDRTLPSAAAFLSSSFNLIHSTSSSC